MLFNFGTIAVLPISESKKGNVKDVSKIHPVEKSWLWLRYWVKSYVFAILPKTLCERSTDANAAGWSSFHEQGGLTSRTRCNRGAVCTWSSVRAAVVCGARDKVKLFGHLYNARVCVEGELRLRSDTHSYLKPFISALRTCANRADRWLDLPTTTSLIG